MQPINRYLVVLGREGSDQITLNRALAIASVTGAELHLLNCSYSAQRGDTAWPEDLLAAVREKGIAYTLQTRRSNSKLDSILTCIEEQGPFGMLIKANSEQHGLLSAFFTPTDWRLLRKCPIPTLLVKKTNQKLQGPVLAAVYPESRRANKKGLNGLVLRSAAEASSQLRGGALHITAAYPAPMQAGAREYQSEDILKQKYRDFCHKLCNENDITDAVIHIDEGPFESLVPQLSKSLDACLVVLGTLARTGINGALMGNTAEQILSQVDADILVLKPSSKE